MERNGFKLMFVVASRPNFMKVAPLVWEAKKQEVDFSLFYTEQHKSELMSGIFAKELNLPAPNYNLNLKKRVRKSNKFKKGLVLISSFATVRKILKKDSPNIVVVVGDVVSSAYIAIVAKILSIPVAHVEAGLRSNNVKMPEEIARRIIDKFSTYLFTHEESANRNLLGEGKKRFKIHFVGNTMIDSLIKSIKRISKEKYYKKLNLKKNGFAVLTFHRHENIRNKKKITALISILKEISKKIRVVFPIHPATEKQLVKFSLLDSVKKVTNLEVIKPLGYEKMLSLVSNSKFIMTDSGGLQEETTYLGVPCLTLRNETERPVTVDVGTNTITGLKERVIYENVEKILNGKYKNGKIPELWDGKTARRIIKILKNSDKK